MPSEFDIIKKHFQHNTTSRDDVILGSGDDAAVVQCPPGKQVVITTDTLVEGTHFLKSIAASDLAHRALAVNLSDLAAMGAEPAWILGSLTLPAVDETWLDSFAKTFIAQVNQYGMSLIGGNLTKGPLSVTIQAMGLLPVNKMLRRDQAKVGDHIYVSGKIGCAQAGLRFLKGELVEGKDCAENFLRPMPQIDLGVQLRDIANSCIDISDGLIADLSHLLEDSGVGASIDLNQIPVTKHLSLEEAVTAGEDYELCFTVSPDKIGLLDGLSAYRIGEVTGNKSLQLFKDGQPIQLSKTGYQHFS